MAKQTIPYYPLEKPVLNALVEDALDFAICHGMVMRKENIVRGLFLVHYKTNYNEYYNFKQNQCV